MDCAGGGRYNGVCARCNGKGAVCPACRGIRFVKQRPAGRDWAALASEPFPDVVRCPVCCEGNQVNEVAEVRAIVAYIARSDALAGAEGEVSNHAN